MASKHTDSETNQRGIELVPRRAGKAPVKTPVSWEDCRKQAWKVSQEMERQARLPSKSSQKIKIWGVPRGGIYAAMLITSVSARFSIVDYVDDADFIVDDIIDTGRTKSEFTEPFFALYDLQSKEHQSMGWIIFPWEKAAMEFGPEENIRRILQFIGEDPSREGLEETPSRVVKSYRTLYGGYQMDPKDVLKVFEEEDSDQMVLLKNIEFYSTCEHHMIPFHGKAHIAYIPNGKVVGISKLARILEIFARRLQIQERLCQEIVDALDKYLEPLGAACMLEAQHMCMTSRGVEKQNSVMVTSHLSGVFQNADVKAEFYQLIGK